MGRGTLKTVLAALIVCTALSVNGSGADANGVPVDVYLSYLPGQSNWGPQNAQGKAHVEVAEGHIAVDAVGLPRLKDEHYAMWMESRGERLGSQRNFYLVGKFNPNDRGEAHFDADLDVPNQEYRMLFLSVERDGLTATSPDARRSLAGMFPNKTVTPAPAPLMVGATELPPASEAGGARPGGTAAGVQVVGDSTGANALKRPVYLPVTGIQLNGSGALIPLAMLASVVVIIGFKVGKRRGLR